VPLAEAAGRDAALSNLLIKAVIRPNPGLQMSSLVSQVCPAAAQDKAPSVTHLLALSQLTGLGAVSDIFHRKCDSC